jgi:hypothetical protein
MAPLGGLFGLCTVVPEGKDKKLVAVLVCPEIDSIVEAVFCVLPSLNVITGMLPPITVVILIP